MSLIKLQGNASGTGAFTIAAPNGNTDRTLTLPDATGTVNVSGLANEVPAGSAGAPAIYPTGDSNTGIFFPAADTIAFSEGGVESMRITSTGNVGIGTTTPRSKTEVNSGVNASAMRITDGVHDGSTSTFRYPALSYWAKVDAANRNGTDPLVTGGSTGAIVFTDEPGNATFVNNVRSSSIEFWTAGNVSGGTLGVYPAMRMKVDSRGNLLLGTTNPFSFQSVNTPGAELNNSGYLAGSVSAGPSLFLKRYGTTGEVASFWYGTFNIGSISTNGTSTSYNTSSDYRLKEDWQPMTGASERVMALKPVNFAWKADGSRVDGFLAHEAKEVVPEAVAGEKDAVDADGNPQYQGIDQSKLVPLLTAALQEALAEIANLKTRLTALEAN